MSVIAALGHVTRDVVSGAPPRPGGAVFYSARALARVGADAHVAASCARKDRTELIAPLEAFGLPVRWFESATTTRYSFRYDGDRRIMLQEAVGEPWSPEQAMTAVGDARWVHVGALVRSDFGPATLATLAQGGRRLLVDAQGLVRTPVLGPLQTDPDIGDTLSNVSILHLDEQEAETLAGSANPERLRTLGVPEILLTLGSRGAVVVTEHLTEHIPAGDVEAAVDPTGAGDTFSAAYLTRRAAGAEPLEAARVAAETVASFLSPN